MAASPTARTLAELRKRGYIVAVVERWNPYARIRQDLFGFIDVLAIKSDPPEVLAVQATSGSNHAARVRKILEECENAAPWLRAGGRIEVWAWTKRMRGKSPRYELRAEPITADRIAEP